MADSFPEYLKSIQAQLASTQGGSNLGFQGILDASKPTTTSTSQTSSVIKKDSLRFMLVSTHIQQYTGYSRVSQNILKELSKHPEISLIHYGFQRHPNTPANYRGYPNGVDVIDAVSLEQPVGSQGGFGFSALPDQIRKKKPHVIMIYNDMSVIMKFLEEIRKSGIPRNFKIWLYVDQVYNCQLQGFIDLINRDADRVFA